MKATVADDVKPATAPAPEVPRSQHVRDMMLSLTAPGQGGRNVPTPSRYVPRPDIAVRPLLSLSGFIPPFSAPDLPSVIDSGDLQFVTAGRIAIALAFAEMGLGEGEKVLIPAYHCVNMIDPLEYTGSEPVFYKVKEDLSIDLDDIAARIDDRTRVLMATHYFGFPQDMPRIRRFCDEKGILLLEDCAHAFFGECGGRPIGSWGDYAIASLKKFFPVYDGGVLISAHHPTSFANLRSQGVKTSIKAAMQLADVAVHYGRLPLLRPFFVAGRGLARSLHAFERRAPAESAGTTNPGQLESGGGGEFDVAWCDIAPTAFSKTVCTTVSYRRIVARRRRNFELLRQGLAGLQGCRPIHDRLPDGVVPYEFPIWVDDLDDVFPKLEDAAVPMHRFGQFLWEHMDERTCPVTAAMSHHGVQLPCHQDLDPREIASIIDRVRRAIAER